MTPSTWCAGCSVRRGRLRRIYSVALLAAAPGLTRVEMPACAPEFAQPQLQARGAGRPAGPARTPGGGRAPSNCPAARRGASRRAPCLGGEPRAGGRQEGGREGARFGPRREAAAALPEVEQMVRQGQASAWGTKERLGALCGRPEIAVLAILDGRLAQRLFGAIAMALRASDAAFDAAPEVRGKSRSPLGGHSEVE